MLLHVRVSCPSLKGKCRRIRMCDFRNNIAPAKYHNLFANRTAMNKYLAFLWESRLSPAYFYEKLRFWNCVDVGSAYKRLCIGKTFKDVRANCFCASLLRTQIHTPRHASMRCKMNNHIIGQMAIAIALPGFNDFGSSVTAILLIDDFLHQFSTFIEKWRKSID